MFINIHRSRVRPVPQNRTLMFVALVVLAVLVVFSGCKSPSLPKEDASKLDTTDFNLILISLDSLRQDHLGTYGYSRSVSPFLDRMSRQATVFTDVFAQSPATVSSHYSIFTSRYVTSAHQTPLQSDQSLAGLLAGQGWQTAAITGGGIMSPTYLKDKGFKDVDSMWQSFQQILDKARDWVLKHKQERFFLFLHTYQIHAPFLARTTPDRLFQDDYTPAINLSHMSHIMLNRHKLRDQDLRYLKGNYDLNIRYSDTQLAEFFDFLKGLSLDRKTIWVIMSDHGVSFGERSYVGHCQLYEVQLRVPLIFYIPGLKPALIEDAVENIDISPTLLKLFHYPVPPYFQGSDLSPTLFRQPERISKIYRRSEYDNNAIRSRDGWKMIIRKSPELDELYYIPEDPAEETNLIQTNPEKARALLDELQRETGRPLTELRKIIFTLRAPMPVMDKYSHNEDNALHNQLKELGYIE